MEVMDMVQNSVILFGLFDGEYDTAVFADDDVVWIDMCEAKTGEVSRSQFSFSTRAGLDALVAALVAAADSAWGAG